MNAASRLDELRADFLDNTTVSMPIAGIIFWGAVAVASMILTPNGLALLVLFGSGMSPAIGVAVMLAYLYSLVRMRRPLTRA